MEYSMTTKLPDQLHPTQLNTFLLLVESWDGEWREGLV